MKRLAVLLLALVIFSCGKRGDPKPPLPVIPKATNDLVVTQRGARLILTWSFPGLTTAGTRLEHVDQVVVYRLDEGLPPSLAGREPSPLEPGGEIDPRQPREINLWSAVPPVTPQQFVKLRNRVAVLDPARLTQLTVGSRVVFEDTPPMRTEDGRPMRATYAVATEAGRTASDLSNLATVVPLEPPMPPAGLTARAEREGVRLRWTAPERTVLGSAEPTIIGYNVFRFPPAGTIAELGAPVSPSPIKETEFLDKPPYGEHRYVITAVTAPGPPPVQSDPTPTVFVDFKDIEAPPAPTGFTVLVEERSVRLLWDPVTVPDLAGYRVYRGISGQKFELTKGRLLTEAQYRDENLEPGRQYIYSVAAVDRVGNEGMSTFAQPILISE